MLRTPERNPGYDNCCASVGQASTAEGTWCATRGYTWGDCENEKLDGADNRASVPGGELQRPCAAARSGTRCRGHEGAHGHAATDAPAIPANVLFDTQGRDPVGPEKSKSMSYSVYRWYDSDTYAGWSGVENSALALAEMAPILLIPRACANGKPAPVDRAAEGGRAGVGGGRRGGA
jgi:hypothetical protein